MPTPFTHLAIARRMLNDERISPEHRALLNEHSAAFYLGQVAPDGHVMAQRKRHETHFYTYEDLHVDHLWELMMQQYPTLWRQKEENAKAFLAGYVAHLAVDEHWLNAMTSPYFVKREWETFRWRFYMLHVILTHMDERDYSILTTRQEFQVATALERAKPAHWLPFMSDQSLHDWGSLIHRQIKPNGISETLSIVAPRAHKSVEELRAFLDDESQMEQGLWRYVPRSVLAHTETGMYDLAVEYVNAYLEANYG